MTSLAMPANFDPSSMRNYLISVDCFDGVYQGRISNIRTNAEGFVIMLSKPFKDGFPLQIESCEISSANVRRLNMVEECAPTNDQPIVPPPSVRPPKKDNNNTKNGHKTPLNSSFGAGSKKSPPTNFNATPQSSNNHGNKKETNVTLLKRGNDLADAISSSCVIKETPTKARNTTSNFEMIPGAVLNGKHASKGVLDKLFKLQIPRVECLDANEAPQDSSSSLPLKSVEPSSLHGKTTAKRINVDILLKSQSKSTEAATIKKENEHIKFGDFKQFTVKQKPDPSKRLPQPLQGQQQQVRDVQQQQPRRARGTGPSGCPQTDSTNGYKFNKSRAPDLAQPLNLAELNEDFDFSGNLALFSKDVDSDGESIGEAPSQERRESRRNFRHDENIVNDPYRVTSWLKDKSSSENNNNNKSGSNSKSPPAKTDYQVLINSEKTIRTENGAHLPLLKTHEKKLLLDSTRRLFSDIWYNLVVADRFVEFSLEVQKRHSLDLRQVVMLAGESCNDVLVHRVCQHFLNRGINIILYCPPEIPGTLLDNVRVIRDVKLLPNKVQMVNLLNNAVFHEDDEVRRWLKRVSRPHSTTPPYHQNHRSGSPLNYARILAIDFRVFDVQHMHTMYLGAADESILVGGLGHHSAAQAHNYDHANRHTFEGVVADLGTPNTWIGAPGSTPARAFEGSFFARLLVH